MTSLIDEFMVDLLSIVNNNLRKNLTNIKQHLKSYWIYRARNMWLWSKLRIHVIKQTRISPTHIFFLDKHIPKQMLFL